MYADFISGGIFYKFHIRNRYLLKNKRIRFFLYESTGLKVKRIFIFFIFSVAGLFAENSLSLPDKATEQGITLYWDTLSGGGMLEKTVINYRSVQAMNLLCLTAIHSLLPTLRHFQETE